MAFAKLSLVVLHAAELKLNTNFNSLLHADLQVNTTLTLGCDNSAAGGMPVSPNRPHLLYGMTMQRRAAVKVDWLPRASLILTGVKSLGGLGPDPPHSRVLASI